MTATTKDLIQLAHDSEAADFRDAVKERLTAQAQSTVFDIAEEFDPLDDAEELAAEEGDEIDLDDDADVEDLDEEDIALAELASEFTDEQLADICNNITEEDFEQLDPIAQRLLAAYVASTESEEE